MSEGLLDIVLEHTEKAGAMRIMGVDLRVGEMSGLVSESSQFYNAAPRPLTALGAGPSCGRSDQGAVAR